MSIANHIDVVLSSIVLLLALDEWSVPCKIKCRVITSKPRIRSLHADAIACGPHTELGQEARCLGGVVAASTPNARQLGEARDFEAPPLVIGEVPMKFVELRGNTNDLNHAT